jgi:hypothetical protein
MDYIVGTWLEAQDRRLSAWSEHMHVRVEEKEEDHAEGHEVHIDAEDDAAVVPVPSRLHAADGVHRADRGDDSGEEQERGGTVVRKAREEKSDNETAQDQQTAAKQRMLARIEKSWSQGHLGSVL